MLKTIGFVGSSSTLTSDGVGELAGVGELSGTCPRPDIVVTSNAKLISRNEYRGGVAINVSKENLVIHKKI